MALVATSVEQGTWHVVRAPGFDWIEYCTNTRAVAAVGNVMDGM